MFYFKMLSKNKLTKMIRKVKGIFSDIDRNVRIFQKKTALSCENGCGQCCLSPRVETTVLEMLPLAEDLLSTQQADIWHKKAQDASFNGPCVFYKPDAIFPNKGRCLVYAHRPGICRLFGFSSLINKMGKQSLVTCSIIKNKEKEKFSKVQDMINSGWEAPVMKEYSDRMYQLHPVLGCRPMPINLAFREAVESMSLYLKCRDQC
jgi:Fe-S-cluster containining protein